MTQKAVSLGVSAKFQCVKNNKIDDSSETYVVVLEPVIDGSEENEGFYNSTPYGELVLGGVSKEVSGNFEIGEEYYLSMIPARTIGVDYGSSPSRTASWMPRNIMTSKDEKTLYGSTIQFKDAADFRIAALETIGTVEADEVVSVVEIVPMRPATKEELEELQVEDWWFELQPRDDQNTAVKHYKVSIVVPNGREVKK